MKSKKLFAILTLVAFMMTLVPMAAFGYSNTYSTFSATGTSISNVYNDTTEEDNVAKFTLTFKDSEKNLVTGQTVTFSIQTSNDLAVGWVDADNNGSLDATDGNGDYDGGEIALSGDTMFDEDGQGITVSSDENGKVFFYLGSKTATSFKVSVYDELLVGDGHQIGDTKTVTVERAAGDVILEAYASDDDDAAVVTQPVAAGEGFDLRADVGSGESDVVVTFKQRLNGGTWTTLGTDETNDDGVASMWIDATAAGTYEFKAVSGSDTGELTVSVAAGEADTVEFKTAAGKIALDKGKTVEIYVKDENGNLVKESGDASVSADPDSNGSVNIVSYEFTAAPDGSEWADESGALATSDRGIAKFVFTPDETGTYTIKVKLESADPTNVPVGNDSATITFECVDLGTVSSLSFDLVNLDGDAVPSVRWVDADNDGVADAAIYKVRPIWVNADGVKVYVPAASLSDITFASSDASAVSVDDDGLLTVEDDEFVGTVTITATYEDDSVVGSYDVKVAGKPNSFTATPVYEGKTATVKVQLVDKAGNPTTSRTGDFVDKEALKVLSPAAVTISGKANLDQAGAASFTATAAEYGKYNVTLTAYVDGSALGITKTVELNFAQPAAEIPVIGAKNVTMFIGAAGYTQDGVAKVSDVAPFIKDGRTFVAVRPVAEAFGATVGYNEATKTVTLTRSDVTVTIVIGSNAITVVKGGVTSTVTADVAAFIQAGRTVLPFRAVGDAFGAKVNYDAATQAVTYAQ